jgi:beta-glucanase (GH16 family)
MQKYLFMIKKSHLSIGIMFLLPHFGFAQCPANDLTWITSPKFSDDFNTLNPAIWNTWNYPQGNYDFGFDPNYVTVNSIFLTGNKVLELKALKDNQNGTPIHSGSLQTGSTYKYGYFESRCNFSSTGPSYMPAFWLYMSANCDCKNNNCPGYYDEIDMEIFSKPAGVNFDLTTNFWYKRPPPPGFTCQEIGDFNSITPAPGLQNSWHKYGIEWVPDHVVLYYDDVPFRIKQDHIPDHAMAILFSLGFNSTSNTNNTFPGYQYIDYVKVYDLNMTQCATTDLVINTPFNPGTYDFNVKRNITFALGNTSLITSGNITLRASNSVIINGDFTVQGADFTILPTQCY